METTLQLATNQGVVLPPRSAAAKNVLANVSALAACMAVILDHLLPACCSRHGMAWHSRTAAAARGAQLSLWPGRAAGPRAHSWQRGRAATRLS